MKLDKRFSFIAILVIWISAPGCERREPTYVLRQMHGDSTFNHHAYDPEVEDKVRYKYMSREEAARERRMIKQREAEYARRKKLYFPRK